MQMNRNKDVLPKRRLFLRTREIIPSLQWQEFLSALKTVDIAALREDAIEHITCDLWDCITPIDGMNPEKVRSDLLNGDDAREIILLFENGILVRTFPQSPYDSAPITDENAVALIEKILQNVWGQFINETIIDEVIEVLADTEPKSTEQQTNEVKE